MRGIIKKTWMTLSVFLWIAVLGLSFGREIHAAEISEYNNEKPTLDQGIPGIEDVDVILTDDFLERVTSQAEETGLSDEDGVITSIKSSELNTPHNWSVTISGRIITAVITNDNGVENALTMMSVSDSEGNSLAQQWENLINTTSTIILDLSDTTTYPDGTYSIMLYEGKEVNNQVWSLTSYNIQIVDGVVSFAPGGCSSVEQALIEDLNANYNPELYDEIPLKYYPGEGSMDADNLDDMVAKAQELTADCATDEEKMKAIHDWVCEEFAYDYESVLNGDYENQADAEWVFNNKRAVCSGFSRMSQIMLTAVGVPCMNVVGFGDGYGVSAEAISGADNHEWNVVYLNGSWRIMDITWDCENRYYGSYDGSDSYYETTLGNAPSYVYYGIPAFSFGITHCSHYIFGVEYENWYSDAYVESIALQNTPTAVFELNDTFSGSYRIICYMSDGTTETRTLDGSEYATGYDMTKNGYQMIELLYGGKTLAYEILVGTGCEGEHTYETWTTILEATCDQDGLKQANCTECNKYCEEIICADTVHELETETIITEPTCTTEGSKTGFCKLCKEDIILSIPVVNHEYVTTFIVDKETSCKEAGSQSYHCKWYDECGQVTNVTVIDITDDHVYDTGVITREPTCTTEGETMFTCTVCEGHSTEVIATLEHKYEDTFTVDQEANCTETGSQSRHCQWYDQCGTVVDVTEIEKSGIHVGEWKVVAEPTYTTEGSKVKQCTVCAQVLETESIPKKEVTDTEDEPDAGGNNTDTKDESGTGGNNTDTKDESGTGGNNTDTKDESGVGGNNTDTKDESGTGGNNTDTKDESGAGGNNTDTKDESGAGGNDTEDDSDIEDDWDDSDTEEEDWDEEDEEDEESDEEEVTVGTEITINKCLYRVTSVGKNPTVAFVKVTNKKSVKSLTVPAKITFEEETYKVTSVESKAFSGCKQLKKIVLPNTITKLGSKVFSDCKKLKTITIKSSKLKTLHKKTFSGVTKKTVIKVPKKKVNDYKKLFRKRGLSKKVAVKK